MLTNEGFGCGHENPASSYFCGVCGAARLTPCRLCKAPMHWDARYCSACGNRRDDEAAAVETVAATPSPRQRRFSSERVGASERGDAFREQDVVHWAARRARHEGGPGLAAHDPLDEDGAAGNRRRRPVVVVTVVAVTLAVVVAAGYFAAARHSMFFERMQDPRDVRASTPVTQPEPSPAAGQSAVGSTSSPPPSRTARSTAEDKKNESRSAPAAARQPPVQETRSAGIVGLPAREPARELATTEGEESPEPSRIAASSARTSEERMAAFLVQELGAEGAAQTALSNADWYDEGQPEREYWQRVAEAVSRRRGR